MNVARPAPQMGNLSLFVSSLLSPRGGAVTVIPGTPVPISYAVVGSIAAGVIVLAMLKKKKVI